MGLAGRKSRKTSRDAIRPKIFRRKDLPQVQRFADPGPRLEDIVRNHVQEATHAIQRAPLPPTITAWTDVGRRRKTIYEP